MDRNCRAVEGWKTEVLRSGEYRRIEGSSAADGNHCRGLFPFRYLELWRLWYSFSYLFRNSPEKTPYPSPQERKMGSGFDIDQGEERHWSRTNSLTD